MSKADIRWIQRFQNCRQALSRLTEAVKLAGERPLSELEQQGLIQGIELIDHIRRVGVVFYPPETHR